MLSIYAVDEAAEQSWQPMDPEAAAAILEQDEAAGHEIRKRRALARLSARYIKLQRGAAPGIRPGSTLEHLNLRSLEEAIGILEPHGVDAILKNVPDDTLRGVQPLSTSPSLPFEFSGPPNDSDDTLHDAAPMSMGAPARANRSLESTILEIIDRLRWDEKSVCCGAEVTFCDIHRVASAVEKVSVYFTISVPRDVAVFQRIFDPQYWPKYTHGNFKEVIRVRDSCPVEPPHSSWTPIPQPKSLDATWDGVVFEHFLLEGGSTWFKNLLQIRKTSYGRTHRVDYGLCGRDWKPPWGSLRSSINHDGPEPQGQPGGLAEDCGFLQATPQGSGTLVTAVKHAQLARDARIENLINSSFEMVVDAVLESVCMGLPEQSGCRTTIDPCPTTPIGITWPKTVLCVGDPE